MEAIRLYTGADGESHFEDIDIPLKDGGDIGRLSEPQKATSIIFRETARDYDYDWHNALQRQYIIMLDAGVEIELGDGTKRIINAGEILLAEDTTGQGHISRALQKKPRKSFFITLD